MNSWSDYVIEGKMNEVLYFRGERVYYGDYVLVYGRRCGDSTSLRIGSGILIESNRRDQIALTRIVDGSINYIGFDEIERLVISAPNMNRLHYKGQPTMAVCGTKLGAVSNGQFFGQGEDVIAHLEHALISDTILTIGQKGIHFKNHGKLDFNKICRLAYGLDKQPKLAKDCTPTELREIADLKEHIEYQKVKIAKLEEDAKVASFKINHQAETIKKKDSQIYNLYASNQKLKNDFWKEEARANRAYDLIESMPKVIVNHYKNKLAKQGY